MKDIRNVIIASGTALLIAIISVSVFFNRSKADDVISVSGLGRIDFVSDLITWRGSFSKSDIELQAAYAALNKDSEIVKEYILKNGIRENELTFSSVDIQKLSKPIFNKDGYEVAKEFSGYEVKQSIKIESNNVDLVEKLSRTISELIKSGVVFISDAPDYFYTKLPDAKLNLIAQASQDAQKRAQQIAQNAQGTLGKLRFSNMGVIQIIEANSAEETSWDGAFNTKAKKKTATMTIHAQYELR